MSYRRSDQIYEALDSLRQNLRACDGSNSMGFVTPEMEAQADKIRAEIRTLENEQSLIKSGALPNPVVS